MTGFTTALDTADNALERVGGKGRSLSRLANAGFAVPGGFQVIADAYRRFVSEHALQTHILELARPVPKNGAPSFDGAADAIGGLFADHALSETVAGEIRAAYEALPGRPAVAVRSSANAEDLPGLSFAGQQETFLNIRGADAVVQAVKDCWASLWTTQAISYRHRNGIDPDSVAMAVVVQVMVRSEVSGILFTANPATGERGEMIVNASFGLGEAVVGGQVTPDTYIVDRTTLAAKKTVIGPKEQQIVSDGDLGVRLEDVAEEARKRSSLSEDMLRELAETALSIERLFEGVRRKTSNGRSPPANCTCCSPGRSPTCRCSRSNVEWIPRPPAKYLSRRQIVENMPDPICPLFEELYLTEGLESSRGGKSLMVGGGPIFVTLNGYAYQRFDWPQFFTKGKDDKPKAIADADLDKAEYDAAVQAQEREMQARIEQTKATQRDRAEHDIKLFASALPDADRAAFKAWFNAQERDDLAYAVTLPVSDNPTYTAFNNTAVNDRQLKEWHDVTRPRLVGDPRQVGQARPGHGVGCRTP